jgi:hypothetical protein
VVRHAVGEGWEEQQGFAFLRLNPKLQDVEVCGAAGGHLVEVDEQRGAALVALLQGCCCGEGVLVRQEVLACEGGSGSGSCKAGVVRQAASPFASCSTYTFRCLRVNSGYLDIYVMPRSQGPAELLTGSQLKSLSSPRHQLMVFYLEIYVRQTVRWCACSCSCSCSC